MPRCNTWFYKHISWQCFCFVCFNFEDFLLLQHFLSFSGMRIQSEMKQKKQIYVLPISCFSCRKWLNQLCSRSKMHVSNGTLVVTVHVFVFVIRDLFAEIRSWNVWQWIDCYRWNYAYTYYATSSSTRSMEILAILLCCIQMKSSIRAYLYPIQHTSISHT